MFANFRKHQGILWVIIIAATIGSFLILGPTNSRMGNISNLLFGEKQNFGVLAGEPITTEDFNSARAEIMLREFLHSQKWPDPNSSDVIRDTYLRLMLLHKEKELGVEVSTEAAAAYARRLLGPNPGALDEFTERILKPVGLDAADFERFLRHDLGIEQIMAVASISGKLVTPQEAETIYRLEHRDIESDIVYFSASNYLNSVPYTPDTLKSFYTNQLANYRVPDQVQVKYVKFNITNYIASTIATMTNLQQAIDGNVEHMGTNLYPGTKTAADSRLALSNAIIRHEAITLARKASFAFAEQLDKAPEHTLATFESLASSNKLSVGTVAPFEREYGPQDIKVPPDFARKAFGLSADDLFAGDIAAEDGVYFIAFLNRTPSHVPTFEDIREKVTEDFRLSSGFQLAQNSAIKFYKMLTNGIAQGTSFQALCAQAGFRYQSLPPFSLSSSELSGSEFQEKINFNVLKEAAFGTPPGNVSPPVGAQDGAFILYVEKMLPVDEVRMKTEFPRFLAYVRQARQNDAFNQWFNTQMRQDPEFLQGVQRALNANSEMKPGARRTKS